MAIISGGTIIEGVAGRNITNAGAPSDGTSEIFTLTFGGTPTGGTFKLGFDGYPTDPITWSSTNATLVANIDAALEALASVGTGNVTTAVGSMTSGIGTITVTGAGSLAKKNLPALSVANNSLTGTSPTLAAATTTAGVDATGRGFGKGQILVDTTNGTSYINTGTAYAPVWKQNTQAA